MKNDEFCINFCIFVCARFICEFEYFRAKMDELKIINQMYLDGKSAGKGKGKKKMKEEELKKAVNANEEIRHDVNHSKDLNELAGEFQTHLEKVCALN
jgi:hypothetical protein